MKLKIPEDSRKLFRRIRKQSGGIQMIVTGAFSLVSCIMILLLGFVALQLFSQQMIIQKTDSAEQFLNQTKHGLEDYLKTNRRISDALYYTYIKNVDIEVDSMDDELNLIYESNKDNILRIALYSSQGKLLSSVPVSQTEDSQKVVTKEWFKEAYEEMENLHFTMPYVQNISNDPADGYRWVISLSRAVELNVNGVPTRGVLVFDLKYSTIQQMIEKVNSDESGEYIYLCDGEGNIIYHPKRLWMNSGHYSEATLNTAITTDGVVRKAIDDHEYLIVSKTVSYTGWKLVSVIPKDSYRVGQDKMLYILALFLSVAMMSMLLINRQISRSVTRPLIRLDDSIHDVERGNLNPEIYEGGPREVVHLSKTLKRYIRTIRKLMDEVVEEQELKRQSELDALQSQINPHFLYNTLDSVIWMIEDEQNEGAVYMIKELSKLLRISINKGRSLITVRDEIRHAQSYINIQQVRYKDQFSCEFDIDEEILDCGTIKLIVQPLLENAISHGVQGMGDEGEIIVRGYRKESDIYIEVMDNGHGMSQDQIDQIFADKDTSDEGSADPARKGNGVGMKNVNSRIKMQFGDSYGLTVTSELGEGTTMQLKLPFKSYLEEMEAMKQKKGRG